MQSHFSAHTLAEIYRDLFLSERSGILTLEREGVEKRIWFDRGLIVFADSTAEEDDLGQVLIEEGKISSGALEEARANIETPADLPRILANRDLIGREALNSTLQAMVRKVVLSTFRWEGGRASVSGLPGELPRTIVSDVLSTCQLLLDGILELKDFEPIERALSGLDRNLHLSTRPPLPVHKLSLSPSHGFILSRIDGTTSFAGVVSILPPSEEGGAARFLYGLLVLGVAEFQPPLSEGPFRAANILRDHADRQAMERLQERTIQQAYANADKDPYTVLGVGPEATQEIIERAYADAKAAFSRKRILQSVREKYRSHLAVIESKLIEAYLKLSQPENESEALAAQRQARLAAESDAPPPDLLVRPELDKARSKLEQEKEERTAEAYYNKAKVAMRDGDFHNAIQFGKLALSHNDRDARYFMLVAECQAKNPNERWQHFAEQNYAKAVELDPWNTEYLITLGRFYKVRGLKLRARKQFEEALRRVPHHEEALQELATLD